MKNSENSGDSWDIEISENNEKSEDSDYSGDSENIGKSENTDGFDF